MEKNKILLSDALNAYQSFKQLAELRYNNFETAYKIANAFKDLRDKVEFYSSQEQKLMEAYAKKDSDGKVIIRDGNVIDFETPELSMKYRRDVYNLQNTEVEIFDTIIVNISDVEDNLNCFTPIQLISLEKLIKFKYKEDD